MRRVRGVCGPNAVGRVYLFRSFGLGVRSNRFISIIKDGNSKGASVLGVVYNDVPISTKGVLIGKISVSHRGSCVHRHEVNHMFRSPSGKAYPSVAVLRGLTVTSGGKGTCNLKEKAGRTEVSTCHRLLTDIKLKLRSGVRAGIKTLSNKRQRALTLLVTAVGPVRFLVLSRRATTLSPGATRVIVRLAKGVMGRGGIAAVVIARGLHCTIRCNSHLLVVRRKRTVVSGSKTRGRTVRISSVLKAFGRVSVRYKGWRQ